MIKTVLSEDGFPASQLVCAEQTGPFLQEVRGINNNI